MRLVAACPLQTCKVKNVIEIEEPRIKNPTPSNSIPKPSTGRSGVLQFSITHSDHSLIIDVDQEGTIRKYLTIPKIHTIIQHYIATIANRIRHHSIKFHTLYIISRSKLWMEFFIQVAANLLENYHADNFNLEINKSTMKINMDQFKVIITQDWSLLGSLNSNLSIIIDQEFLNSELVLDTITSNIELIDILGVALDTRYYLSDTGTQIENAQILISQLNVGSIYYMVPDLESVGLFALEILDNLPF